MGENQEWSRWNFNTGSENCTDSYTWTLYLVYIIVYCFAAWGVAALLFQIMQLIFIHHYTSKVPDVYHPNTLKPDHNLCDCGNYIHDALEIACYLQSASKSFNFHSLWSSYLILLASNNSPSHPRGCKALRHHCHACRQHGLKSSIPGHPPLNTAHLKPSETTPNCETSDAD